MVLHQEYNLVHIHQICNLVACTTGIKPGKCTPEYNLVHIHQNTTWYIYTGNTRFGIFLMSIYVHMYIHLDSRIFKKISLSRG